MATERCAMPTIAISIGHAPADISDLINSPDRQKISIYRLKKKNSFASRVDHLEGLD